MPNLTLDIGRALNKRHWKTILEDSKKGFAWKLQQIDVRLESVKQNFITFPPQIFKIYWGQILNIIFPILCGLAFQNLQGASQNFKGGSLHDFEGNKLRILKVFWRVALCFGHYWGISSKYVEDPPFVIMLSALGLQGGRNLCVWRWSVQTQGCTPLLKPRFSSMFSWKSQVSMTNLHFCPESVSESSPNQGFAQFGQNKNWKRQFLPKKSRVRYPCDALRRPATFSATFSATLCDVFCDTLRHPATPCDVFWRVFGRFCHFWPRLSRILENKGNVPNFRCHVWFPPSLMRIWTRKGSLWQRLCCCSAWQNLLSHSDGVFVLFHDLIANLHHFSFQKHHLLLS